MRINIAQILVSVSVVAASVGCGKFRKAKEPVRDIVTKPMGLNLSVDASDYSKSKYCGDVRPATAQDPTPPYTFEDKFISDKLASADGFVAVARQRRALGGARRRQARAAHAHRARARAA